MKTTARRAESPLRALLGPLEYVSANDFANLPRVKGLGQTIRAALAHARLAGVTSEVVRAAEAHAARLDSRVVSQQRAAVEGLLALVRAEAEPDTATVNRPVQRTASRPAPQQRPPRRRVSRQRLAVEPTAGRQGKAQRTAMPAASGEPDVRTSLDDRRLKLGVAAQRLARERGASCVGDVIWTLPRGYEDRRELRTIARCVVGEVNVVLAVVHSAENLRRVGRRMFRAVLTDGTGRLSVTYFQSRPWLAARFPVGSRVVVIGEVQATASGWDMPHPEVESADSNDASSLHRGRFVPVYPGLLRHQQRTWRSMVAGLLEKVAPALPDVVGKIVADVPGQLSLADAVTQIHFPPSSTPMEQLSRLDAAAHQRIAYDELFFVQLALALRQLGVSPTTTAPIVAPPSAVDAAMRMFPFALTPAQQRVCREILGDLARTRPMHRLLQGDVGSGKTAVAAVAARVAIEAGYQVVVMAPTELLAQQHYATLSRTLPQVSIALVTQRGTAAGRRKVAAAVAGGATSLVVGTHALIQESISFSRLGLAVIDEQHRFGVLQRSALADKGWHPHVLVMTATPIPRTLAMAVYGDLDVSVIDALPPGRTPIVTRVVWPRQRPEALQLLKDEVSRGRQAYVVFPLVEESETLDVANAVAGAEALRAQLPGVRIGLVHGRMRAEERDSVMADYRNGAIDVLATTTVIEVGVDVPNASVMLIESAERFGLAQLHQLRGRVGRGASQSFCVLLPSERTSAVARQRLAAMEETHDGFVIAERDLELRGPGELLGTRQSGIPELLIANVVRHQALLRKAQLDVREILRLADGNPAQLPPQLLNALDERLAGRQKFMHV